MNDSPAFNAALESGDPVRWRRFLHSVPELGFEEAITSEFVARKLKSFGLEVHSGLAKTGVVAVLRRGNSDSSVGLRADLDALPIHEANEFDHRSVHPGKMHACGHDGHTVMLLEAARQLASDPDINGRIIFVFQPAEEGGGGGARMIAEGLFEKFPCDAVFGLHNFPGLPSGQFATRQGAIMASYDCFDIVLKAAGGHAAFPHRQQDVIVAAAKLIGSLQSIVSRGIDPSEPAVVSVTGIQSGGDAYNVLPATARISGSARALSEVVRDRIEGRISQIAKGVSKAFDVQCEITYDRVYPVTRNDPEQADFCIAVAETCFGSLNVNANIAHQMASEDFAFMLNERPGCYMLIGNGGSEGSCALHHDRYDFDDSIIQTGAKYWSTLAKSWLEEKRDDILRPHSEKKMQ